MNKIIKHHFIGQKLEVNKLIRKLGNGDDIEVTGIGLIKSIDKINNDIAYVVEFDIELTHRNPYGTEWKTQKNKFWVFHNSDEKKWKLVN